jgi:citrate synthase
VRGCCRSGEVGAPAWPHAPDHPDLRTRAFLALALAVEAATLLAVRAAAGQAPNIDFALVAACERFRLPAEAPFALFAVARCAGWIAHAIEQGQTDALIRPRARYVGPEPETVTGA